jgi:hypothetical protein
VASRPLRATLQASLGFLVIAGVAGDAVDAGVIVLSALDVDGTFNSPIGIRVGASAGEIADRFGLGEGEGESFPGVRSGVLLEDGECGRDFGWKTP